MEFRPCIDIHNGKVKQIVGGTLGDKDSSVKENYISDKGGAYYARLYRNDGLKGGHVIMLNPPASPEREATQREALHALSAYPGGLQIGGGITAGDAGFYLDKGASHVIVTSGVFEEGSLSYDKMEELKKKIGKKHIVIDLSCRYKEDGYYIVTNRWQTFTKEKITHALLEKISGFCDEFLIHGVDVEGKGNGMEEELLELLSGFSLIPITYAGGISTLADIDIFRKKTSGNLNFTIGSALDIFGGNLAYRQVINRL